MRHPDKRRDSLSRIREGMMDTEFRLAIAGREFSFSGQRGVFSADGPDEGSVLLLETLLPHLRPHQSVLDVGCGTGLIGVVAAFKLTRGEVYMVDSDIRCVRLAQRNVARNHAGNVHVVLSDVTSDLPAKQRFDLVVSNPPTHQGRDLLEGIVRESHARLKPGGWLWLVVNRLLSTKDIMSETFGGVEVMARRRGFLVLRSSKPRVKPDRREETTFDIG